MTTRVEYVIAQRYEADAARATAQVDRYAQHTHKLARESDLAEKAVGRMERRLSGIESAMRRATAAAVGFGLYRLGGAAIDKSIGGLERMEGAILGVAGSLRLNEAVYSFESGMARAEKSVGRFREMAKKSAGGTSDFVDVYQATLGSMLPAGRSDAKMEQLTQRLVLMSATLPNTSAAEVGQSAAMVLGGAAGIDSVVWRMLRAKLGGDVAKWNKLAQQNPAEAFDRLAKALERMDEIAAKAGSTFSGLKATLGDIVESTLQDVGKGMFEAIRQDMEKTVEWYELNEKAVKKWARDVGEGIVKAYSVVRDTLGWVVKYHESLISMAKHLAYIWASSKLVGFAKDMQALGGMRAAGAAAAMLGGDGGESRGGVMPPTHGFEGWSGRAKDPHGISRVQYSAIHGYHRTRTVEGELGRTIIPASRAEMWRERGERAVGLAGHGLGFLAKANLYVQTALFAWETGKSIGEGIANLIGGDTKENASMQQLMDAAYEGTSVLEAGAILGSRDRYMAEIDVRVFREKFRELTATAKYTSEYEQALRDAKSAMLEYRRELERVGAAQREFVSRWASWAYDRIGAAYDRIGAYLEREEARRKAIEEAIEENRDRNAELRPPKVNVGPITITFQQATNPERAAVLTRDILLGAALSGADRRRYRSTTAFDAGNLLRD